jgi:hypothetical protein
MLVVALLLLKLVFQSKLVVRLLSYVTWQIFVLELTREMIEAENQYRSSQILKMSPVPFTGADMRV